MDEIVLWYDYIENGSIRNNLQFEDGFTKSVQVGLPNFFIQNNINFTVATTAYGAEYFYEKYSNLKNVYPVEFLFYNSLAKIDKLQIGDHWFFKKRGVDNFEILFWYPNEGFEIRRNNEAFNQMIALVRLRFPKIKIRFVFGNFVKSKNIPDFAIYKCFKNYFWFDTVNKISKPIKLDPNKESRYDFITLNMSYRESRYMIFTDLKNSGMLANAKYTNIFNNKTFPADRIENKNSHFILEHVKSEDFPFIQKIQTDEYFKTLYDHAHKTWGVTPPIDIRLLDIDLINCSYLEVVNETVFDSTSNLFITEKTFRAIAVGHIFLICGQPKLLEHLKHWGFYTFDDLFDESYDNLCSFSQRWAIIKKNLQLWIGLSDLEKQSYYRKSFYKLVHNQNLLYNRDFKTEIEELFKD